MWILGGEEEDSLMDFVLESARDEKIAANDAIMRFPRHPDQDITNYSTALHTRHWGAIAGSRNRSVFLLWKGEEGSYISSSHRCCEDEGCLVQIQAK